MDRGFFQSKQFFIGLAVCALIVTAGVVAAVDLGVTDSISISGREGCETPTLRGEALPVVPTESEHARFREATRVVTYELPDAGTLGGEALACAIVGGIKVEASPDNATRVIFTIDAEGSQAIDLARATGVGAWFAKTPTGGLSIAAWQENTARTRVFFDEDMATVRVRMQLPDTGPYQLAATLDVGIVSAGDLQLQDVAMKTDVGDLHVSDATLVGNATLHADVGDIDLSLLSASTGTIRVTTDVGSIDVFVPKRADLGYDVQAKTDVGTVDVDIGEAEKDVRREDIPGETADVRSSGYAGKPSKVAITVVADVGDIRVIARGGN